MMWSRAQMEPQRLTAVNLGNWLVNSYSTNTFVCQPFCKVLKREQSNIRQSSFKSVLSTRGDKILPQGDSYHRRQVVDCVILGDLEQGERRGAFAMGSER